MPGTYFCFSDECGAYMQKMSMRQLEIHPFYIRTTLLINSSEWKQLNSLFRDLKIKYSFPLSGEIKWSNLWTIKKFQTDGKKNPFQGGLKYFEKFSYETLVKFVDESIGLLDNLKEKKVIIKYSKNSLKNSICEKTILTYHLQEHIQRLEMEFQSNSKNLGVLFFDPLNNENDGILRNIYNDLFENGDFISKYKHIKDSLNFENSHHSVGIQLADYISGTFNSILKTTPKNNYTNGVEMFYNHVYLNLRRSGSGAIQGYGIREVPSNPELRDWLKNKIKHLKK